MRRLLPAGSPDAGPLEGIGDRSDRPPPPGRPWVMANMVMSVDGAYAVEGRSGGLSGSADKEIFGLLRAATDVVLVAAGTARTERYRRPRTPPDAVDDRRRRGLGDDPQLVVVSRSLRIPDDVPLVHGEGPTPILWGPPDADTSDVAATIEFRPTGTTPGEIDLAAGLAQLRSEGTDLVLCEGGPGLLGALHAADLLDELFVSVSPVLVGGDRTGLLGATPPAPHDMSLHRVLEDDGFLFLTYRRSAGTGGR